MTQRRDDLRGLLLVALIWMMGALALPTTVAGLSDEPPAAITLHTATSERSGVATCWLQSVVGAIIQRVPDPMTRLQLWQIARQRLPSELCCTANADGPHLPHYTGRVTVPGACGARR